MVWFTFHLSEWAIKWVSFTKLSLHLLLKNLQTPIKRLHHFLTKIQHSVDHCKLHVVRKCTEMQYSLFRIWFFVWMWLQSLFHRFPSTDGVFSSYVNSDRSKCKLKYSCAVLQKVMRGNRISKHPKQTANWLHFTTLSALMFLKL